ncbi:MAG: hypothetical protein ACYS9Y_01935 [Planctomycetota bacterium]|jgi:uncharacterized lipoprotein YehR (DUF1307 family)
MNTLKKIFVLVLIVAVVSLSLTGCKDKSEPSSVEQPSEETISEEHPTSEHPTSEHPK